MEKRLKIEEIFTHPWVLGFEEELQKKLDGEKEEERKKKESEKKERKEMRERERREKKETKEKELKKNFSSENNVINPWASAGAGFYHKKNDLTNEDTIQKNAEIISSTKEISGTIIDEVLKNVSTDKSSTEIKTNIPRKGSKTSLGENFLTDLLELKSMYSKL